MPASSTRSARPLGRLASFVALSLLAFSALACNGDDDPAAPGEDFAGIWESDDGFIILEITATRVDVYIDVGSCYDLEERYTILSRNGNVLRLEEVGTSNEDEVEVNRSGDSMVVTVEGDTQTYSRISSFNEC